MKQRTNNMCKRMLSLLCVSILLFMQVGCSLTRLSETIQRKMLLSENEESTLLFFTHLQNGDYWDGNHSYRCMTKEEQLNWFLRGGTTQSVIGKNEDGELLLTYRYAADEEIVLIAENVYWGEYPLLHAYIRTDFVFPDLRKDVPTVVNSISQDGDIHPSVAFELIQLEQRISCAVDLTSADIVSKQYTIVYEGLNMLVHRMELIANTKTGDCYVRFTSTKYGEAIKIENDRICNYIHHTLLV